MLSNTCSHRFFPAVPGTDPVQPHDHALDFGIQTGAGNEADPSVKII